MDFEEGLVVRAKAGRDKNDFFVIVKVLDDDFVLICNGKQRPVEKPKKKKKKHLCVTKTVLPKSKIDTNKKIKKELNNFNLKNTE